MDQRNYDILIRLDPKELNQWLLERTGMTPDNPEVTLAAAHKARFHSQYAPGRYVFTEAERKFSEDWLHERGFTTDL